MASSSTNITSKISPSTNQHIMRLAAFTLASTCALLVVALKIQTTDAHSVNAIRGPGTNYNRRDYPERMEKIAHGKEKCDNDAEWRNNRCLVFTQTRRTHSGASRYCADEFPNGSLPTIYNDGDNRKLTSLMAPYTPIWLGARYNFEYNKTYWGSYNPKILFKQEANYTNWDAGQPDMRPSVICVNTSMNGMSMHKPNVETIGKAECVSFWNDGKWSSAIGCQVLLQVVCERNRISSPPSTRYTMVDGTNGTSTSQYEQQQMYPVSSANTFNQNNHFLNSVVYMLTAFTIYATLNQQTVALVK